MARSIYPDYPPTLTSEQSGYLLSNIKDWSILNGLAVRPTSAFVPASIDPSHSLAVTAPVTLFPSLFPRACFEEARAIQTAYNELYALVAKDDRWLQEIVEEYAILLSMVPDLPSSLNESRRKVAEQIYPRKSISIYLPYLNTSMYYLVSDAGTTG